MEFQLEKKKEIQEYMKSIKNKKDYAQPTKIKTGGSTFKNPIKQTNQKVWELIKKSVSLDTKFGDAEISKKHCNFFINEGSATSQDIEELINKVRKKVFEKTGIKLELELRVIGKDK